MNIHTNKMTFFLTTSKDPSDIDYFSISVAEQKTSTSAAQTVLLIKYQIHSKTANVSHQ